MFVLFPLLGVPSLGLFGNLFQVYPPVIHYPTLRFQASLSEWWVMDEIDESIFFMNNCSLYLRMCIFCSTFAP